MSVEQKIRLLGAANARRTAAAAKANCERARSILANGDVAMKLSNRDIEVLTVRANDPHASLRDLAAVMDMTKDQFSSALRRAFRDSERHSS